MVSLKQIKEMSLTVSRQGIERRTERNTLEKTHLPKNSLILFRVQVSTESEVLSHRDFHHTQQCSSLSHPLGTCWSWVPCQLLMMQRGTKRTQPDLHRAKILVENGRQGGKNEIIFTQCWGLSAMNQLSRKCKKEN